MLNTQTLAFRVTEDVESVVKEVAKAEHGGNVSKLLSDCLHDYLRRGGHIPKTPEEENIYKLVREASEAGIDVATLLKVTMRKGVAA
ncbi:MAG: hypothetical protein HRU10_09245 [Opitutales bacterium]|nr:hypothetical protein [Opitutales bacterium]